MNDEKNDVTGARTTTGSAAKENMSASHSGRAERATPSKAKAPPAQDRWFDTQLSRMYADLAAEPLPKEMMSLLEKLKTSKT